MKTISTLFACVILLLTACDSKNTGKIQSKDINNPITASGSIDMSTLPVFEFKSEEHDFGKLGQGEVVSYTFKFKNTGKSDLIISEAKATCGCTVADYPKVPIKPEEESGIALTFNTEGKKGIQNKTITLVANTQPNTKVLTIKAEIIVPLNN